MGCHSPDGIGLLHAIPLRYFEFVFVDIGWLLYLRGFRYALAVLAVDNLLQRDAVPYVIGCRRTLIDRTLLAGNSSRSLLRQLVLLQVCIADVQEVDGCVFALLGLLGLLVQLVALAAAIDGDVRRR